MRATKLSPGQTVLPTPANSSQVHNFDGVGYRLATHLAWVGSNWLEFDQIQIFVHLEPRFPPFYHLSKLEPTLNKFCFCYVTTRSYSDNWMASCKLARLGGTVWSPADASCDFVTWLEFAWVGSTVWPGLYTFLADVNQVITNTTSNTNNHNNHNNYSNKNHNTGEIRSYPRRTWRQHRPRSSGYQTDRQSEERRTGLTLSVTSSKSTFSQPFREKCAIEVVRISSIFIFHLSKLWKAKFFILCDVIFLVRLQGNVKLISLGSKRANVKMKLCSILDVW